MDLSEIAIVGALPIETVKFCVCAFCIGISEATRIVGSEECVLYRESHDRRVFENVIFACWSKFLSRE